jgi:hypothetical protein
MDVFYLGSGSTTAPSRANQRWGANESSNTYGGGGYNAATENKYEDDRKRRDLNSILAIPPPLPLLPQK